MRTRGAETFRPKTTRCDGTYSIRYAARKWQACTVGKRYGLIPYDYTHTFVPRRLAAGKYDDKLNNGGVVYWSHRKKDVFCPLQTTAS